MRWDLLVVWFTGLIPQRDDDMDKMYQWRWKSVALGVIGLLLALYGANLLPGVPPPYAMADTVRVDKTEVNNKFNELKGSVSALKEQVDTLVRQNRDNQIRLANNDLLDARRYQCRAINSGDKSALPFWNNRISDLKLTYLQLTGSPWADLPCNSF